ncbi:MAG: arylsulfatase [Bacteroidota bacterium]
MRINIHPSSCVIAVLLILNMTAFAQDTNPNILLILADDLGYSSIEPYGSKIKTPFLSKLANQSVLFTNFHALPTCSPSRSVLLTGADNHIVGIGAQKGGITDKQKDHSGYEGYLNFAAPTLAELLGRYGYRTYMSGKWHLGSKDEHAPSKRGFEETFSLISSGGSHYADQKPLRPAEPVLYRRNGVPIQELPDDFYSTKNYTDSLLHWLERDRQSDRPFFAYLAYTAPHDPLQAPEEYIQKYKGIFDEGFEVVREEQFNRLKELGIIEPYATLPNWPRTISRWNSFSDTKKEEVLRDMETFAAMIDYMDEQMARVYQWLEEQDILDETVIIFLSDNGISGINPKKVYHSYDQKYDSQFDNSLENRGLINSFTVLDAGWALASNVVYREFKYSTAEGGVRTPCIIKPARNQVHTRSLCKSFTHISDLLPTILEMTHIKVPDSSLIHVKGKSLSPLLSQPSLDIHQGEGHGFELHANRAYIKNGWKIFQSPIPTGSGDWELYNLTEDPGEQHNLIYTQRNKFNELYEEYLNYEKEVGVVYDLPLSFGKIDTAFKGLLFTLVAMLLWGIWVYRREWLQSPQSFNQVLLFVLLGLEVLGIVGLFTIYNPFATYLLLATKGFYFFGLVKRRVNWKVYLPFALSVVLLGLMMVMKSGLLMSYFYS